MKRKLFLLFFILLILVFVCQDLYCLVLIAYNYSYWSLFFSSFHIFEKKDLASTLASETQVPRILHQSWKTSDIPDAWRNAQQSCKIIHQGAGYEYRLWTDVDAEGLIAANYSWFLSTYKSYPHDIQRADAARYFILHNHGGIYLDLDIYCQARTTHYTMHYTLLHAPSFYMYL